MRRTIEGLAPPGKDEYLKAAQTSQVAVNQPLPPGLQAEINERARIGEVCAPLVVSFTLPLECLTPIVGGGVESRTPDEIEGVRIPGIRGQLRMWRALQPEPDNDKDLFEKEARLWGGVGLDPKGQDPKKPDALRSKVILRVTTVDRGQDMAAGRYIGERGSYKAVPVWEGGAAMGYGLFPLQLEREELRQQTIAKPPTRSVRKNLQFDLHVSITLPVNTKEATDWLQGLREVLGSLWAWIHFGGVGSRTTRGFGALAVREKDAVNILTTLQVLAERTEDLSSDLRKELADLFALFKQCSSKELARRLKELHRVFDWPTERPDEVKGFHPRLPAKSLLCGQVRRGAMDALHDGLDNLKNFRQGPGVGRNSSAGSPRPGRSYWPEADTLRRLALKHRKHNARFQRHPPTSGPALNGAPRAAFGMPLNTSFKDQDDKVADGVFMPTYGERWTSPLRMRPLRCSDGYVCLMIYMNQPFPQDASSGSVSGHNVRAVLNQQPNLPKTEDAVLIKESAGAQKTIQFALDRAKGDAVAAFLDRLTQRGFQKVQA